MTREQGVGADRQKSWLPLNFSLGANTVNKEGET